MADRTSSPSWWRVAAAFVLAPGLAALILAPVEIASLGLPVLSHGIVGIVSEAYGMSVSYAYPVMILLGVPAFFVLRRRVRPSALNCALAGAVVASLPWLLLVLVLSDGMTNWREVLFDFLNGTTANIAAGGVLGGVAFWAIATAGPRGRIEKALS